MRRYLGPVRVLACTALAGGLLVGPGVLGQQRVTTRPTDIVTDRQVPVLQQATPAPTPRANFTLQAPGTVEAGKVLRITLVRDGHDGQPHSFALRFEPAELVSNPPGAITVSDRQENGTVRVTTQADPAGEGPHRLRIYLVPTERSARIGIQRFVDVSVTEPAPPPAARFRCARRARSRRGSGSRSRSCTKAATAGRTISRCSSGPRAWSSIRRARSRSRTDSRPARSASPPSPTRRGGAPPAAGVGESRRERAADRGAALRRHRGGRAAASVTAAVAAPAAAGAAAASAARATSAAGAAAVTGDLYRPQAGRGGRARAGGGVHRDPRGRGRADAGFLPGRPGRRGPRQRGPRVQRQRRHPARAGERLRSVPRPAGRAAERRRRPGAGCRGLSARNAGGLRDGGPRYRRAHARSERGDRRGDRGRDRAAVRRDHRCGGARRLRPGDGPRLAADRGRLLAVGAGAPARADRAAGAEGVRATTTTTTATATAANAFEGETAGTTPGLPLHDRFHIEHGDASFPGGEPPLRGPSFGIRFHTVAGAGHCPSPLPLEEKADA